MLGAAVAIAGLLAISALATSGAKRSAKHGVVKHHYSLLSVRYLHHDKANQLAPGSGSTRRSVKQGPTGLRGPKGPVSAANARSQAEPQTGLRQTTCPAPDAPGSPAATGGANQAAVNWTAPNANGSTITGYLVTAHKGAVAENAQDEPAAATTATLSGLSGGSYTFTVVAQSSCGDSAAATTSAATVTGGATYASTVFGLGASAYFRLGEPSGTANVADSSGRGLVGSYNTSGITLGATGALPSDTGATSVTDTTATWVGSVPSPGLPVGNEARTVQAWVKPGDTNCRYVLGFGSTGTDNGYSMYECPNSIGISAFSDDLAFNTPQAINDGAWHLITITYDGNNVTAYLDTHPLGTKSFANPLSTAAGTLYLGAFDSLCCGNWAFGGLQEEAVFPKALTAAQVTSEFNASGYGVPTAPGSPSATGAANAATVHWTASTAPGTSVAAYIITAKRGTTVQRSIAAPASATSVKLTGLPAGSYTFTIAGRDTYGSGAAATTAAATVTGTATTYASTVLTDRPSVFYRLDEGTGTPLAADSSGHSIVANYATSCLTQGVAGPLPNDPATGVSSSACNNIASVPYSANLPSGTASRTLQAWIKPSDSNCRWFMGYGTNSITDGEFAVGNCFNSVMVRLSNDDHSFFSSRNIADGSWHLVTVTDSYSATTGNTITAYLDGQKLGAQVTNALNTPANTGLTIGSTPSDCCYFGGVADAAVYPAALSATQIAALVTASGNSVPTAPSTVTATGASNNTATVAWHASTATGGSVTGYVVTELSAGKPQQSIAVGGSTLSARVSGLPAGSYTFKVVAYDTYGSSAAGTSPSASVTGAATTYASTVLASRPALYDRLNEPTGATLMADSSGNGTLGAYDATGVTHAVPGALADTQNLAATQSSGFLGEAGGSATIPSGDGPRTLEAWVKPSDAACVRYVASFGTTSTDQGFLLGECPHSVIVDGYSDQRTFNTPRALNDGTWHFLAATYNDVNGVNQVTAYLDGVSLGTKGFSSTLATPASSTLWIGAGPNDCCTSFSGGIDEVAVFPSALSAATIAGQFSASGHAVAPAPTAVTATPGANRLTVHWTAPTVSAANPITAYLVSAYAGSVLKSSIATSSALRTTTLSGLPGGIAYTVKVVAYNAYGPGAAGASAAATPTGGATTYASTLLSDNPLVYYRLAEANGAPIAADSSGNGMQGAYNPSVTTFGAAGAIPTDPATSVTDNGNNSVVSDTDAPGNKLPVANHVRTLMAWVRPTDANCRYAMGYGGQGTDQAFGLVTCPHSVQVVGGNDDHTFGTTHTLNDGSWHQVVATYDGTNVTAYVDGVNLGSQPFTGTLNTPTGTGLYVGAGPQDAGSAFLGGLDDVAVLPAALSDAQVGALFSASGYGVPSAPAGVGATAGANQATVTWSAASAPNTGVTGYVVTAMAGGTVAANAVATSGSSTSATLSGLRGAHAYTFRVVALDAYGAGPAGTSPSVTPTGSANTFAADVIGDGPVAYYRLNETNGSVAADSSGNGNLANYNLSATTLGSVGALPHDPSTSITDNGNAYAAAVPNATSNVLPSGNAARSIVTWIKPADAACTRYFVGYGTTTTAQGFGLGECPGSVAVTGWSDDLSFSTGAINLDDGNWHMVVATYDGAGNVSVYVDNTSLGTQALGQQLNTTPNTGLIIGQDIGFAATPFNGGLQDAAVFPSALSSAQVTTLYGAR